MALHGLNRLVLNNAAVLAAVRGTYVRPKVVASRITDLGRPWLYRVLLVFLPGVRMFAA